MIPILKKKSIAAIILTSSLLFAAGCGGSSGKSSSSTNDAKAKSTAASNGSSSSSKASTTENNGDASEKQQVSSNDNGENNSGSEQNISEKVKNYILNGQNDKSEAQKIKWSKTFLDEVDIDSLYKKYKANGGSAYDIESFAAYITQNAPIYSNWQELFKKDLKDTYGEDVVKLVDLGNNLYQAYVMKNGSEVPYVVVSARTGYFHG